uniref:Kynurenine--oxoglutarate transaminase 3 n=1 Tax=Phallusia mammillata TaxID=59560 RepID=A0A6F9D892_9ASCI|nr:kynurenine--oxoglutarate transaminase 3-like [Phallusia mammillata]
MLQRGAYGSVNFAANRSLFAVSAFAARANCFLSSRKKPLKIQQKTMSSRFIPSKRYDGVDRNVWIEFTTLAAECKAVNLGQGFPDFSPPEHIKQALADVAAVDSVATYQYTRGVGHPRLVKTMSKLFSPLFGIEIDALKDILITIGGYGALYASISAFIEHEDEVIIVEPFFDCYEPMVKIAGGIPKFIPLKPKSKESAGTSAGWTLDRDELEKMFNKNTKAIIINTPNNPLGKVYSREELELIAEMCIKYDCLCISDEVYEWLLFEDNKHVRIASLPGMWDRTLTIGSAGKTFSVTGWKLGWAIGPSQLIKHLQTVWQNSVYTCPTPLQEAVARGFETEMSRMGTDESYFKILPEQLQAKRDRMVQVLKDFGLKPIIPQGGYFLIADISSLNVDLSDSKDSGDAWDYRLVKWLTRNKKLATIPTTAFYCKEHRHLTEKYIRFCFCKEDETIEKMEKILKEWSKSM